MNITLPDGSKRELKEGSTGLDLAMDIGPGLAKAAIAITVNGDQKDLCDPIEADTKVSIITIDSSEGLEIMRHTLTAQVLARAVKNLYPDTKLAIGPTISDGFYYDFEFTKPISPDDLQNIEKEMRKIIDTKSSITKTLHSKEDALEVFKEKGEVYKESIIKESNQDNDFQLYYQDDDEFVDLCRGPHLPSLKHIGSFKLTKLAGAYWKGDSKNKMLTRIYGTAWKNDKDLNAHLHSIEEAEKRDHRKLGKEMNLFHFQEEAPGMVFWHPDGWTIYRLLQEFIRNKLEKYDYKEINTPQVVDRKLWEASGHWDKYRENMFITEIDEEHANEKRTNALKPMNCPCHVQVYNQGLKSYRDLPLRYAEFGSCHRYEASGTMHGLMRVRGFTQDDGHIFCTEEQIESETKLFIQLLSDIYNDLGFKKFDI
ncbi:threonine--tRNA ligase, partial [Gammaproteobacteria bacterium]|nr:threonine--tRNA ligase [Gammaproteobacteria bacterium]